MANLQQDAAIQALLDKQAILEVLYRYCQGCDRSDAEMLQACFHPDAITDHSGVVIRSWEWIPQALGWLENRVAATHMVTNPLITLSGDKAVSDCHFLAYNRAPDEAGSGWIEMVVKGRYLDRFERRDGVWRIIHRIGIHDVERFTPAPAGVNEISGNHRSLKKPEDPLYPLLAALGA